MLDRSGVSAPSLPCCTATCCSTCCTCAPNSGTTPSSPNVATMRVPSLAHRSASSIPGSICSLTTLGVTMRVRLPGSPHIGTVAPVAGSTNSRSSATPWPSDSITRPSPGTMSLCAAPAAVNPAGASTVRSGPKSPETSIASMAGPVTASRPHDSAVAGAEAHPARASAVNPRTLATAVVLRTGTV